MAELRTLVKMLCEWSSKIPDAPAVNSRGPGGWTTTTWRQYEHVARTVAKGLVSLGIKAGDAVAIIGRNRAEWLFADLGILAAGAVPAPIYITNTPPQVAYVVRHCRARVIFAENKEQYDKLASERRAGNLPLLEKVVLFDDVAGRDLEWSILWKDLLAQGEKGDAAEVQRRIDGAKPGDLALLCYTSGTTGDPKGVMLSHANMEFMAGAILDRFQVQRERTLSYLPLCHVAEHFFTIGAQMAAGNNVFMMCEDIGKVKEYLVEVKPTLFLAVPRVWEKFEAALRGKLGEAKGIKARLARWALATELACFRMELESNVKVDSFARRLARKLVISKIKNALGLSELKLAFTGAAPMNPRTAEFFASLGMPVHDCYGMTETTAVSCTSLPLRPRPGTVGKALRGVELKLAEDGEILTRGPHTTPGYLYDEKQTAELLDADGWLHTGDIGAFDEDGTLRITDRKKELFKTSGGKYVAPQLIESKLKSVRGLSQAVAVGDAQKYIAALVALCPENAPKVAAELGIPFVDLAGLAEDERMRRYVDERIEKDVNPQLARYEQVKKVAILAKELSVDGGELTPTLKLKRKVIAKLHASKIEALFAGAAEAVGAA